MQQLIENLETAKQTARSRKARLYLSAGVKPGTSLTRALQKIRKGNPLLNGYLTARQAVIEAQKALVAAQMAEWREELAADVSEPETADEAQVWHNPNPDETGIEDYEDVPVIED